MTFTDLTVLDQYRAVPLPATWDLPGVRTLYSPVDQVHAALVALVSSATVSLDIAMYGFDDLELANAIEVALQDPAIAVSLTLDSSQAGGATERRILEHEEYPNSDIAIGRSEKGAIIHLKEFVIDGAIRASGSTNWSAGGEAKQDNELTVIMNAGVAAEATARIDAVHAWVVAHYQTVSATRVPRP